MDIKQMKELINKYETLLYGNDKSFGLIQCLDPYYNGAFDNQIDEIEKLRKQILS